MMWEKRWLDQTDLVYTIGTACSSINSCVVKWTNTSIENREIDIYMIVVLHFEHPVRVIFKFVHQKFYFEISG